MLTEGPGRGQPPRRATLAVRRCQDNTTEVPVAMTVEHIPGHSPNRPQPPIDAETISALRNLPPRRPAAPADPSAHLQWRLVDVDRYEVARDDMVLGFVEVVGAVYVALRGPQADRAVEVAQTLIFADALSVLAPLREHP